MIVEGLAIRRATLADLDQLLEWRMEVLHAVFAEADARGNVDWEALREASCAYYVRALGGEGEPARSSESAQIASRDARAVELARPSESAHPGQPTSHDARARHIACFAELDGQPVACGSICLQEELPSPDNPSGRCAYLMNMYTRPAHRGKGIAGAVVDWVVDQAKRAGAGKIYLETTPAGRGVYERAGFVDLPAMMKLEN